MKPLFEVGATSISPTYSSLKCYRCNTEEKLSIEESQKRITRFIANNDVSIYDIKIFAQILSCPEIMSKLIWVTDGSYRNNRIYYRKNHYQQSALSSAFYIEDRLCNHPTLKSICQNYKSVFIQLINDEWASN